VKTEKNTGTIAFRFRQVLLYFPTLSHKTRDLRKKVIGKKMCVLIFSTTFVWNVSHSDNKRAKCDQKCISVFMWSARYVCLISINIQFSRQIFEKCWSSNFHENPSSGIRDVPCGRADRQTDTKMIDFFLILRKRLKLVISLFHRAF